MKPVTVGPTGVTAKSLAENKADLETMFRDIFGASLSLDPATPQGQIIGVLALRDTQIGEEMVRLYQMMDPASAEGVFLGYIGSMLGPERIPASRSMVTATIAGVAGTGVPKGSRAKTVDGDVFETLEDAVIAQAGTFVDMAAVDTGPVAAAAGTLTGIVTVVPGWETITNAEAAVPGRDAETDTDYRGRFPARSGRLATAVPAALVAAVAEAGATRVKYEENRLSRPVARQLYPLFAHHQTVIAEGGTSAAVQRAIEANRGAGSGTMTAIRGGTADEAALAAITAGTLTWDGQNFTGLDLLGTANPAARANALTVLLANANTPVAITYVDGAYVASYGWREGDQPVFGDNATTQAFGLDPANASASTGPFLRPRVRDLVLTATVTRQPGFPADGVDRIRTALVNRAAAYDIGEQAWLNDFLSAAETVPGTRISALTLQYAGADVSGTAVPLDSLWRLTVANITLTVS